MLATSSPSSAIERVEFISVEKDAKEDDIINGLEAFDIDDAHCFGPNEEFMLRQIIHDIGVTRLTTSIRDIVNELKVVHAKKTQLQEMLSFSKL